MLHTAWQRYRHFRAIYGIEIAYYKLKNEASYGLFTVIRF